MSAALQPCPRCHAETGWLKTAPHVDGRKCAACNEWSSNCEISRGKVWTQKEIDQMLGRQA